MSYYVKRTHKTDIDNRSGSPKMGWVGPIKSVHQANREVEAWESAGWDALPFESTPAVKAAVKAWQKWLKSVQS